LKPETASGRRVLKYNGVALCFYCAVGNEGRVIMLAKRAPKFGVAVTVCPIVNHDFKSACFLISNNLNWR
jgi:hypothetical protein